MPHKAFSAASPRAAINVTPLIDVMLVLLILFMVVTPLASRSLDTRLPRTDPSPGHHPPPPTVLLEMDAVGLKLNGTYLSTQSQLAPRLRDLMAVRSDKTLFVRASGELGYGSVVAALDIARGAGVERIGLLGSAPISKPGAH